ncbi:N-acetyltransferase [Amycolatopsis sp. NBRC 101858]|uniref:GNAT family N-acetyltransferase n=1 Tax=Amycolatopsis sp. NBRC 101858 TaxID=3032200 RepID=UPI0024A41F18|nr:GNAT family protein [Amycolatopsis sp. NBRC 101858]GLY44325.1 N-acetyltransferase [Amycolatopsis sp. NBRC 101858]
MTDLPPWPASPPACDGIFLRPFTDADAHLGLELGEDPYVPLIGSLAADPTPAQALEWVRRQPTRYTDGTGFSFAVADAGSGRAVGSAGLWLQALAHGRASAGYSVSPAHRGRGVATSAIKAVTAFAWTIPALHRIELYIEPWNTGSSRAAHAAGYAREGVLRSHQEIGGTRRDMALYAAIRA